MFNLAEQKKNFSDLFSRLFQKNKYERLIEDYQSLSQQHPNDLRIRLRLAETYFKAKDIENTIRVYQEVADAYMADNFYLKAAAVYKNILRISPTTVDINLKLAELYIKIGMQPDAINQFRIAMEYFDIHGNKEALIRTGGRLLEVASTAGNRRKMGEIYQNFGMINEALEQYEILAREFRTNKKYDELLRIYELILPHKPKSQPLIRDICILYLRRQEPDYALRLMERYHVDTEPAFAQLFEKSRLMREALRKPGSPRS